MKTEKINNRIVFSASPEEKDILNARNSFISLLINLKQANLISELRQYIYLIFLFIQQFLLAQYFH